VKKPYSASAPLSPARKEQAHINIAATTCLFAGTPLPLVIRNTDRCPWHMVRGSDLARPFNDVWNVLETYALPLNRLYRQLAKIHCKRTEMESEVFLAVAITLPNPNQQLRLLLNEADVRYYWDEGNELIAIDPHETQVDRAVYLILAELAKQSAVNVCESPLSVQA